MIEKSNWACKIMLRKKKHSKFKCVLTGPIVSRLLQGHQYQYFTYSNGQVFKGFKSGTSLMNYSLQ